MRENYDICYNKTNGALCTFFNDCGYKFDIDSKTDNFSDIKGCVVKNYKPVITQILTRTSPHQKPDDDTINENVDDDVRSMHSFAINRNGSCNMVCTTSLNSFIRLPSHVNNRPNKVNNKVNNKVCLNNDTFNDLLSLALKNCS